VRLAKLWHFVGERRWGAGKAGGRKECMPAGKNSYEGDGAGAGADITEGMLGKKSPPDCSS